MNECYNAPYELSEYVDLLCREIVKTDYSKLSAIADAIMDTKRAGKRIYLAGNGGSGASASHMTNDLMKGCAVDGRIGFPCVCLNDPNPVITCLANDFSYEEIFSIMLRTYGAEGDLLIVFSGSGNSPNIIAAIERAKSLGMKVIGFGGRDGGKMRDMCDICLVAPTYSMEQLEDMHIVYIHALVCRLKELLHRYHIETGAIEG